jgi:hypothetical protein
VCGLPVIYAPKNPLVSLEKSRGMCPIQGPNYLQDQSRRPSNLLPASSVSIYLDGECLHFIEKLSVIDHRRLLVEHTLVGYIALWR